MLEIPAIETAIITGLPEQVTAKDLEALNDKIEEVAGSIPANVERYFTKNTVTIGGETYNEMQDTKPTDNVEVLTKNITAITQQNAEVVASFISAEPTDKEINFKPQNTTTSIQALRTAGNQTITLFAKGYVMDENNNKTLLSTSKLATITNNVKTYTFFLPLPEYTAPINSRAVIEILAFKNAGGGTHTVAIRIDNDTMSRWSYNLSASDIRHKATSIDTTHANNSLLNVDKTVQADIDELDEKIDTALGDIETLLGGI